MKRRHENNVEIDEHDERPCLQQHLRETNDEDDVLDRSPSVMRKHTYIGALSQQFIEPTNESSNSMDPIAPCFEGVSSYPKWSIIRRSDLLSWLATLVLHDLISWL